MNLPIILKPNLKYYFQLVLEAKFIWESKTWKACFRSYSFSAEQFTSDLPHFPPSDHCSERQKTGWRGEVLRGYHVASTEELRGRRCEQLHMQPQWVSHSCFRTMKLIFIVKFIDLKVLLIEELETQTLLTSTCPFLWWLSSRVQKGHFGGWGPSISLSYSAGWFPERKVAAVLRRARATPGQCRGRPSLTQSQWVTCLHLSAHPQSVIDAGPWGVSQRPHLAASVDDNCGDSSSHPYMCIKHIQGLGLGKAFHEHSL